MLWSNLRRLMPSSLLSSGVWWWRTLAAESLHLSSRISALGVMSLPVIETVKAYWLAIRLAFWFSLLAAGMSWAYLKGGEKYRLAHAAYVNQQQIEMAMASARWAVERAHLEARISNARALTTVAQKAVEALEAEYDARVSEVLASAKSAPVGDEIASQINKIVDSANR